MICREFPVASLNALVVSEPREPFYPVDRDRGYFACIFTDGPVTKRPMAGKRAVGKQALKDTRILCKGTHGVSALDAAAKLLDRLRVQLGLTIKDAFGCDDDDYWRLHLHDDKLDIVLRGDDCDDDEGRSVASAGASAGKVIISKNTMPRTPDGSFKSRIPRAPTFRRGV